jgi:hypothetical protein
MGRPIKTGLDYFPLDIDMFSDEKMRFISARFDELGEIIIIKLLMRIYRNGYFLEWREDDALLFAQHAGKNISAELVNEVVRESLNRKFFDKKLYKSEKILTSNGIQKRYIKICNSLKRKPSIDLTHLVSSGGNGVSGGTKERKGNERKGNEKKLKESDSLNIEINISDDENKYFAEQGKKLFNAINGNK